MDPTFLDAVPDRQSRFQIFLYLLTEWAKVVLKVLRILFREIRIPRTHAALRIDDGTPASRWVRGLMYRLIFVPVIAVGVVVALVYAGTHPRLSVGAEDPSLYGLHFDPLYLLSEDAVRSQAWLVPALDASRVLEEGVAALKTRSPAAVLVPDVYGSRQQFLPLIRALHEAGVVTLTVAPRGIGTPQYAAVTFGAHEALDVRSAVAALRRRADVDPARITLIGVGTGATASALACGQDAGLKSIVLINPCNDADRLLANHFVPRSWFGWLAPLCKWSFQLAYYVDPADLQVDVSSQNLATRKVIKLERTNEWMHETPMLRQLVRSVTNETMSKYDHSKSPLK